MLALLLGAQAVLAQEPSVSADGPPTVGDLFQARLRYGASIRSGSQVSNIARTVNYTGVTPNDIALQAWGWFAVDRHLGAFLSFQREAFALFDTADNSKVTGGGLIRVAAGPTGRIGFGPVTLEAAVGYAFHQLPTFGEGASPAFAPGARHGILLAGRGLVDVGPVSIEAHGEAPISLSAATGAGQSLSASGFSVGGGLRAQLFRIGPLMWGVLADVTYVSDRASAAGGLVSSQSVVRVGGAADVK